MTITLTIPEAMQIIRDHLQSGNRLRVDVPKLIEVYADGSGRSEATGSFVIEVESV